MDCIFNAHNVEIEFALPNEFKLCGALHLKETIIIMLFTIKMAFLFALKCSLKIQKEEANSKEIT